MEPLVFYRHGEKIVLCEKDGKKPIQKNWQNRVVTDKEILEHDGNFGVRDLAVLDFDNGLDTARTFYRHHVPKCLIQLTRKGVHLIFKNNRKRLRNGVHDHGDYRGIGGYIIIEPSTLDGKHHHRFVDGFGPEQWDQVEEFREEWLPQEKKVVAVEDTKGDMLFRARQYLKALPVAVQGTRDNVLFRCACLLTQKFSLDQGQAYPLLLEFAERQCDPPVTDHRVVARKITESLKYKG